MMTSPDASSWLPWIWALETLASNHADSSVLIDLVKMIPDDVLENDGKNAKESAFLRILEGLSVSRKGKCCDDSLKLDGNAAGFDASDCCENVLRQILLKESSRPNHELSESETLRWDVESFVKNKRSCLPKCTLKQLKDMILKDSHILPSSLKERSGLLDNNRSDGVTEKLPEGRNCDALENLKLRDLSFVKRVVDDLATANEGAASSCRQMIVYNAHANVNTAIKRKRDAFCTQQAIEGNDLASFRENRHVEGIPGEIVWYSGRDGSNLDREPRTKSFHGDISSESVDYDFVASKNLKMSSTIKAILLHNQVQATRNFGEMTRDKSCEEQSLKICADKPIIYGEHCAVLRTLGGSRQAVTHETKSFNAAKYKCKKSSLIVQNSPCCGGVKATTEKDHQQDILSDDDIDYDENDDIIVGEDILLDIRNSDSQDSLAKVNGTKQQLCMICMVGGQLLVCSSGSCQRVLHERCLGVAPTFDAKRRFYCPFCAYSRAVSEYSDSKKQYSLAKKALLSFISRDEYRLRNSNISGRVDRNHLRDIEVSVKCNEQNNLENVVSRVSQARSMMHMKEKNSVSCDLSSRVWERVVTCGGNMVDKQNAERIGSSVCCQSAKEQVQNGEVHSPNCKYLEIAHGSEQRAGTNREQDVSNQPHVLPCEHAKPLRSVPGTSGEKDDNSIAYDHSLRVQRQEQHYPYPSVPQLRRKKVPWSNAEEEALKEGVRRFASDHNRNMPWKKILEFGAEIFEKHRTAIDLKDKWRNICKGSPVL